MFRSHLLGAICLKLLFSIVADCYHCSENEETYLKQLPPTENPYRCYRRNATDADKSLCNIEMKWDVTDNETGSIAVEFALRCDYDKYEVKLMVYAYENATMKQCSDLSWESFEEHSTRVYTINNTRDDQSIPDCSEKGSVSFNFVYTNCYRIDITPSRASTPCTGNKSRVFITTNHTKQLFAEAGPNFEANFDEKSKQLTMTVVNDPYVWLQTTKHFISVNYSLFRTSWAVVLFPNKTLKTTIFENAEIYHLNSTKDCKLSDEAGGKVTCVISNIANGTIEMCKLIRETDRCKVGTVWNSKTQCWWTDPETYVISSPISSTEKYNGITAYWVFFIVLAVVVFLIVTVGVAFGIRWLMKRYRPTVALPLTDSQLALRSHQRLLLLYSRDCQQFMTLMQSFRQLLEEYADFEVIDCYDEQRREDLSQDPIAWVQRWVADREVKIVMVASRCAYLRQEALIGNRTVRYCDPDAIDQLFIPALQYLNQRPTQGDYSRVFVVRFDGFSDDQNLFRHINEYTRYVLPNHFKELVACLHESTVSNGAATFDNLGALRTLQSDLKALITYVDLNQNYLDTLLYFSLHHDV